MEQQVRRLVTRSDFDGLACAMMLRELDLIDEKQPFHQIPAIAFNMADYFEYIKAGNPFDICYSIVENYYRGNSTLQLRIKDIKEREEFI